MKRKAEETLSELEAGGSLKAPPAGPPTGSRLMQGQVEDGKKHSLDSDDEDEVKEEYLKKDDFEGEEDETTRNDGEIAITPFNLKDEESEGNFTKDGDFLWKKDKEEIRDSWLDNVDWQTIKQQSAGEMSKKELEDEKEDEAEANYDEIANYRNMLQLLKPGESVAKALRRLGGNKKVSSAQRWKNKKQVLSGEEKENRDKMLRLTELADAILSRSGNMEVYEETYEKIAFKLKSLKAKETEIPEGTNDDDALDMFASSLDQTKKVATTTTNTKSESSLEDDVKWEFKWENKEKAEIHGPHSSQEMLEWQESGFFESGVFARKVGSNADFNSSKRIDFELYT